MKSYSKKWTARKCLDCVRLMKEQERKVVSRLMRDSGVTAYFAVTEYRPATITTDDET